MKKAIIIVLLAMSGTFSLVSCTDEIVEPSNTETPTTPPPVGGGDQGGKI